MGKAVISDDAIRRGTMQQQRQCTADGCKHKHLSEVEMMRGYMEKLFQTMNPGVNELLVEQSLPLYLEHKYQHMDTGYS